MNESAYKKVTIDLYFNNGLLKLAEGIEKLSAKENLAFMDYFFMFAPYFCTHDDDTEAKFVNEIQLLAEKMAEAYSLKQSSWQSSSSQESHVF